MTWFLKAKSLQWDSPVFKFTVGLEADCCTSMKKNYDYKKKEKKTLLYSHTV